MLYNTKWYNPVFQGVSLREFAAWLETMPPNQPYEYLFAGICAVAKYLQAKGASPENSIVDFGAGGGPRKMGPSDDGYWLDQIVSTRPYTYGAALERARAALEGKP